MSAEEFRIGDYWLTKHSTSPYWQRTWYDAKRKQVCRRSLGLKDFRDAKDALTDWWLKENRPVNADPADISLPGILVDYYEGHASKKASAVQAKIACRYLSTFFAGKMVSEITRGEQDRYVAYRLDAGVSLSLISREMMVLRAAVKRAWKRGELHHAPFIADPEDGAAKRNHDPKGRPLALAEMAALFDAAKQRHGLMLLMILANTMCRPDAALDLTVFQRDREHNLIDLNPPGREQTKKFRPIVPVTATLRAWLDGTAEGAKQSHYVAYHGKRIKSAKTFMRELRIAAGFVMRDDEGRPLLDTAGEPIGDHRVVLYSIRHTMARELRKRGVPGEQIELMLGHRLPDKTTQIYAPYAPDYCRDAVAAIDAYFADLQKVTKRSLTSPVPVRPRVSVV